MCPPPQPHTHVAHLAMPPCQYTYGIYVCMYVCMYVPVRGSTWYLEYLYWDLLYVSVPLPRRVISYYHWDISFTYLSKCISLFVLPPC